MTLSLLTPLPLLVFVVHHSQQLPTDTSVGGAMAEAAAPSELFSEQELTCSICLDLFEEPVSTPCGHNFCQVPATRIT